MAPSQLILGATTSVVSTENVTESPDSRQSGRVSNSPPVPEALVAEGVTRREAEVLSLLSQRQRNDEIAATLHLSVRTVESHVSSLLRKLQAADRRALASRVAAAGAAAGRGRSVLPRVLSSFVGRDADLQQVRLLLDEHTLVTMTGPAGAGKTRLALAVAEQHPAAVFVDLLSQPSGGDVRRAFADALGIDASGARLTDAVRHELSDSGLLLVVDNCEHVLTATARFLGEVLSRAGCRVLVTGREPLALSGEVVHRLGPLTRTRPCASSMPGPRPHSRRTAQTQTTPGQSGRSVPDSTGCRSASSSPPLGFGYSAPRSC
jgi:DNA-binding CsgD family transcriptional regulator